jgi:chloramphenicol 3-O-phosphotransferase
MEKISLYGRYRGRNRRDCGIICRNAGCQPACIFLTLTLLFTCSRHAGWQPAFRRAAIQFSVQGDSSRPPTRAALTNAMKLIIIHGPPAAGKLTVSLELAKRTGYKLFHNHISIDCVKPVFEFGSPPFMRLIELIRFGTIAEAAREGVDLIHTFVYAYGIDDEHFGNLIAAAEDNGGGVHTVLLTCDDETRRQRIIADERRQIGKLTDPDSIDTSREKFDLFSPLPGRDTLVIDTTATPPDESARRIIEYFGLEELR